MATHVATVSDVGRVTYLDPTGFVHQVERQLTGRLDTVAGKVAGLLDNGNDTSNFFFQGLSRVLQEEYGVGKVILETKFTSTKPADPETIRSMSAAADFMVAGVCL